MFYIPTTKTHSLWCLKRFIENGPQIISMEKKKITNSNWSTWHNYPELINFNYTKCRKQVQKKNA